MRAIGLMIRERDKDHIILVTKENYSLVSGLMISPKVEFIQKLRINKRKELKRV